MSLVVATGNPGKLAEIRAMLAGLPVEVLASAEVVGRASAVAEDAATFEGNALKKAREVAAAAMMLTLADDSGLEVDALGGRPGVRSARFAREGATDADNNAELLRQLEQVEDEARTARFRCVLAVVDPWAPQGEGERVIAASCEGRIAHTPSGTGGFGYDPLFIVAGLDRTMAELECEEKNRLSHRGQALALLQPWLAELIRTRLAEARAVLDRDAPPTSR